MSKETSPPKKSLVKAKKVPVKCALCQKRSATKDCVVQACLSCCTDDHCTKHAALRAKHAWRNNVLQGTTLVQQLAKQKRQQLLPKNRFKEAGFVYTGDTVVIWNIHEYHANAKWREDARRRSKRRQQLMQDRFNNPDQVPPKRLYSSRQRFRALVERRYQEHLAQQSKGNNQANEVA